MSNRTTVELNHDYCPHNQSEATDFGTCLMNYMRSGIKEFLPHGVQFLNMRHHSENLLMSEALAGLERLRDEWLCQTCICPTCAAGREAGKKLAPLVEALKMEQEQLSFDEAEQRALKNAAAETNKGLMAQLAEAAARERELANDALRQRSEEADWYHAMFHRAVGFPCDGMLVECKRAEELRAALAKKKEMDHE